MILVWKDQEDGTSVAKAGRLRIVLEEIKGTWFGSVYDGKARVCRVRGRADTAVVSTLLKRIPPLLAVSPSKCGECEGAMYLHPKSGKVRCLTRGCARFKKKV